MSVVALIPAHDEEERIAATVTAALAIRGVDVVLVVDDGSTDRTSALAAEAGAEVLPLRDNLGKGAALDAGLDAMREEADVLLLLDGDLGESAAQGRLLLAPILEGHADMTIAIFPAAEGTGGFGLVKGLARWGIRRLGGPEAAHFPAVSPVSGQRGMTRACWERVTPFAFGYGVEVALTVRALRAGMRIREVPTTMHHTATGRSVSGFAHRGRQFLHIAGALLRLARERAGA